MTKRLRRCCLIGLCLRALAQGLSLANDDPNPGILPEVSISTTTTLWELPSPLILKLRVQNTGTNVMQFPNLSQHVGNLSVLIRLRKVHSDEAAVSASFRLLQHSRKDSVSAFPYLEIAPGESTDFQLESEFPVQFDSQLKEAHRATCDIQIEVEFDGRLVPGGILQRRLLPAKPGQPLVVKSDQEIAAEIEKYKHSGTPLWDPEREWTGKILSQAISVPVHK